MALPDSLEQHSRRSAGRLLQGWFIGPLLFLLALAFNLYRLGTPSIWFDEAFSVELARQPLGLLWHIISGPEPNMELYYLFLHFWLRATAALGFSATEAVVRFPSAIFAAVGTLFVFLLGWRFIGRVGGVAATLLYLLNVLQLTYAQQTRSYSLQLLWICLAWYALYRVLSGNDQLHRWWILYTVAMILAIYSHLFSAFILLAQIVTVVGLAFLPTSWREQVRAQIRAFLLSLLLWSVLSIPMFLVSLHGAKTGWLTVPRIQDLVQLFRMLSGYNPLFLFLMFISCVGACLLIGSSFRRAGEKGRYLPLLWGLICWLVLPIVVSYVISQGSLRLFSDRYLVTIVPPLCLLLGLAVSVLRMRLFQLSLAGILVVLALISVPGYYASAQVEDWNAGTHWLLDRYQAGDGLVCYDNTLLQGCQISVEYYLHAYPNGAHFTSDSPGAFSWQNFGPVRPAGPDEAVNTVALQLYASKHPRIFFIQGRIRDQAAQARAQAAQNWLDKQYSLVGSIQTRTVTVRLYATGH